MEKASYEAGTPSWVDLGCPDAEKAAAFYSALLGWDVNDLGEEAGGYRIAEIGGRPVAGLGGQMDADVPPYWAIYIAVDDADVAAAGVKAAGGTVVVEPMDVMGAGRMAVFTDPAGAPFSVWQAGEHKGSGLVDEPGTMCWHELNTREPEASKAFYKAVFGWDTADEDMGGSPYPIWKLGDTNVGGMTVIDERFPAGVPNHWLVYFAVADCDASVARLTELGGTVRLPPIDIPPGRFSVVSDPDGALFAVLQLADTGA
jgi:predicted enzyme related to lactoylglutathione lyase